MSIGSFLKTLLTKAISIFHKAEDVEQSLFHEADALVDKIKTLEKSEIVQFLETGIETAFPVTIPFIATIKLWLTNASAKLANVQGVITTDEGKLEAFLDYLAKLKTDSPTLYAGVLTTLNADYQQLRAGLENTSLTPQMSLVAAVAVHTDGELGTVAE